MEHMMNIYMLVSLKVNYFYFKSFIVIFIHLQLYVFCMNVSLSHLVKYSWHLKCYMCMLLILVSIYKCFEIMDCFFYSLCNVCLLQKLEYKVDENNIVFHSTKIHLTNNNRKNDFNKKVSTSKNLIRFELKLKKLCKS